jgi:tape measure domain-containing protein
MISQRLQIVIDAENKADAALKQVAGRLGEVADKNGDLMERLGRYDVAFKSMAVAGTAAFAAVAGAIGVSVAKAAEFEQMEIAFGTMLGSAEKGTAMLKELVAFAAKTPFEVKGIQDTARQLLAYGFAQEEVLDNLKILGDIAAGVGMDKLPLITLAFGQVKAATRLTGMELRQFTENGIPLLTELSKQMGISTAEVQQLVTEGKVGFEDVRKALQAMTTEGGRFANMMEKQSTTLAGRWSTFKDTLSVTAVTLGQAFLPYLNQLLVTVTPIITKIGEWVQAHPKLTAGLLAAAAALAGLTAVVGVIGTAIVAFIGMLSAVGLSIGAFVAILATVGVVAGVVVAAIAALIAVGVLLYKNWDEIKEKSAAVWGGIKEFFVGQWEEMKSFVQGAIYFIVGVITLALDNLIPSWREKLGFILEVWNQAWDAVKAKVESVREGIAFAFEVLRQAIGDAWEAIVGIFGWAKAKIGEELAPITKAVDGFIDKVEKAIKLAKSVGSYIVSAGKSTVSGKRAVGGPVSSGLAYTVGEDGEETFVPATAGRIIRNGGLGGTVININIGNNTFMGKEGIAREIGDELMRQLQLRTKLA